MTEEPTTFKVRFWKTRVYKGQRGETHTVRWIVAGEEFNEPFMNSTLADSYRSQLVTAARKGEAFYVDTGLPMSMQRIENDMPWYQLAVEYADMKWPRVAGTTRRTHAEALTKMTVAMISSDRGRPDAKLIRKVLSRWAFNTSKRDQSPPDIKEVLVWLDRNTRRVSTLAKPAVLRAVRDGILFRLDGQRASPDVAERQEGVLSAILGYAVHEKKILAENPLPALKKSDPIPPASRALDKRSVPNPIQVRTLLNSVREGRNGKRLIAFFGCLYYAMLRPEEAAGLRRHNLAIPRSGWGQLILDRAEPYVGKEWTDSGDDRDKRPLKQRAVGKTRPVPCPPELTELLNEHIETFGFGADQRLFVGERNKKELPKGTIARGWREARNAAFTPEVCWTPLAETPYDLRHAGISFRLALGIPATTIAHEAGQSVAVLNEIYAAWLDGQEQLWRNKIDEGFGLVKPIEGEV